MTTREFSQAFDALVSAYNDASLGDKLSFDEYEKSVFLRYLTKYLPPKG